MQQGRVVGEGLGEAVVDDPVGVAPEARLERRRRLGERLPGEHEAERQTRVVEPVDDPEEGLGVFVVLPAVVPEDHRRPGLGCGRGHGVERGEVEPEVEHRRLRAEAGQVADVRVVRKAPQEVRQGLEDVVAVEARVEHDAVGDERREDVDERVGLVAAGRRLPGLGRALRVRELVLVEVEQAGRAREDVAGEREENGQVDHVRRHDEVGRPAVGARLAGFLGERDGSALHAPAPRARGHRDGPEVVRGVRHEALQKTAVRAAVPRLEHEDLHAGLSPRRRPRPRPRRPSPGARWRSCGPRGSCAARGRGPRRASRGPPRRGSCGSCARRP